MTTRKVRVIDRGPIMTYRFAVEVERRFLRWKWWSFVFASYDKDTAIQQATCTMAPKVVWP